MSNSITIHERTFDIVRDQDVLEHVTVSALCEPFGLDVKSQQMTKRLVDQRCLTRREHIKAWLATHQAAGRLEKSPR